MSQIIKLAEGTVAPDIETLSGDTGGAVHPDGAFNISLTAGPGIYTIGDPAAHSITIGRTEFLQATVTTSDAAPTAVLEFDLGTFPAVYTFDGRIAARDVTDVAGGGYFFSAAARTTGAAGVLIDVNFGSDFEEAAMINADYTVSVVGNIFTVTVVGIAGKTIHWSCDVEYTLAL